MRNMNNRAAEARALDRELLALYLRWKQHVVARSMIEQVNDRTCIDAFCRVAGSMLSTGVSRAYVWDVTDDNAAPGRHDRPQARAR